MTVSASPSRPIHRVEEALNFGWATSSPFVSVLHAVYEINVHEEGLCGRWPIGPEGWQEPEQKKQYSKCNDCIGILKMIEKKVKRLHDASGKNG